MSKNKLLELRKQLKDLTAQLSEARDAHKKTGDRCTRIYKKRDKVKTEIEKLQVAAKKKDFSWYLHCTHDETSFRYEARKKFFAERYKGYVRDSGFYVDTSQTQLQICLYKISPKTADLVQVRKALKELVPHLKPVGKYIHIGIFEHTLSEFGIYEGLIDPKSGEYHLAKTTYGREEILETFKDQNSFLKYVKQHHYYEKKEGVYEDEEED